jgi:hypothetical protein
MVQGFIKPVRNILSCLLKNDSKKKKKIATPQIKQIHKFLKQDRKSKVMARALRFPLLIFVFFFFWKKGEKRKRNEKEIIL